MSKINLNVSDEAKWERYKDVASRDVVFAKFSYTKEDHIEYAGDIPGGELADPETRKKELSEAAARIPEGFQLFFCSGSMDETGKHKYRATVFVNNITKEVIVATAGTRFGLHEEGRNDLWNDAFIAFEQTPPSMESIRELNDIIIAGLGSEISDYKLHYTGHSLGAALSDMAAADMAIKLRQNGLEKGRGIPDISTMTFENPGAKKVIQTMYRKAGLDPESYSADVDYKGMNNTKNFINQSGSHAGEMWEVVGEKDAGEPNLFQKFMQYVAKKFEPVLFLTPKLLTSLSFGLVSKQVDTHMLTHFDDVLVKKVKDAHVRDKDTIDKVPGFKEDVHKFFSELVTGCQKILYEAAVFLGLKERKIEKGNVGKQECVMVSPEGALLTASSTELSAVVTRLPSPPVEPKKPVSAKTTDDIPTPPTAREFLGRSRSVSL